jgi:glycosyltransferase involved in cell wall biosynthesis
VQVLDTSHLLGIVAYRIYPPENGGQQSIATFYAELSRRLKLSLLTSRDNSPEDEKKPELFPLLYTRYQSWMNLFLLYKIIQLIKRKKFTCMVVDHSYYAWIAWLLRRFTGVPFIIRSHNIESHRFKDLGRWYWPWYEWYEKSIHGRANYNWWICREDLKYAVRQWKINPDKCSVTTYGTLLHNPPDDMQRKASRKRLIEQWNLPETIRIFYFNGSMNYRPNTDGLRVILYDLLPRLRREKLLFCIIITGAGMSDGWRSVLEREKEILLPGYLPNIDLFWEGSDCFIHPVTTGAGIKTKLVEAMGHGLPCVTTRAGLRGMDQPGYKKILLAVPDDDWESFTQQMIEATEKDKKYKVPLEFFHQFSLQNIVHSALLSLQEHGSR